MKKILFSLGVIGAVSAIAIGATTAFFTDTETSAGNTFTAGTIDIAVDGQNPWHTSWHNYLDKPSQVNYMVFRVQNTGENPANLWKKLTAVVNSGGQNVYPVGQPVASSESEYEAGGGTFDQAGNPTGGYIPRDNISAFMVYDMSVCKIGAVIGQAAPCVCTTVNEDGHGNGAPIPEGQCWQVLVDEADQVRVDNIEDVWIKLDGELQPLKTLVVAQSYHLMNWDDSGEPIIMNWAQGDVMTFDIALEARQLTAPAPDITYSPTGAQTATVQLAQKDAQWNIIPGGTGTLTYEVSGTNFVYNFSAAGLTNNTNYCLIYYSDPWPGQLGQEIACGLSNGAGALALSGNPDTGTMPVPLDANYGVGAKMWLVLDADYDQSGNTMTAWNPSQYLFDVGLVNYTETP